MKFVLQFLAAIMIFVDLGLWLVHTLCFQPIQSICGLYERYFDTPLKDIVRLYGHVDVEFMDTPCLDSLRFEVRNGPVRLKDEDSYVPVRVAQLTDLLKPAEMDNVARAVCKPGISGSGNVTGEWLILTRDGKYLFFSRR